MLMQNTSLVQLEFLCTLSPLSQTSILISVFSSMASSHTRTLTALVIFQSVMYPQMHTSVHVYRTEAGKEELVEREYLLYEMSYVEARRVSKVITSYTFSVSEQFVGKRNGLWDCMFVYDSDRSAVEVSPQWLSIIEDPKMEYIPTLANDLRAISELPLNVEFRESSGRSTTEESGRSDIKSHQPEKKRRVPFLDLNALPCSDSENEENDQNVSENKKRRAATENIARLALDDLAKYFDLPIIEASKSLNVGLTVLKKKCREVGIPRWPHRKIKSLDSLILDLQKDMQRQQEKDELAAITVEERKRMIEYERESIEKRPFMDIRKETKKFRQNMFKRRYKAKVLENQCGTL